MKHLKIGVRLESLGRPLRQGLAEAARLAVGGVQVDAAGDLAPDRLSQTGRRELRNLLRTYNLELTALGCPLRRGLDAAEDQQPRLEHVRKALSLAYDLGPRVVVVQAGQVPAPETAPGEPPADPAEAARAGRLRESLANLAEYGDRVGSTLALETGLESGEALAAYLRAFDTGSLAANLDPANLLLHGFDPIQAARDLRGKIAHTHARDGRRASTSRAGREVPVGAGDIDWLAYLETLGEVEYRGWLVVEREEGDNRLADVAAGVAFLRRMLG